MRKVYAVLDDLFFLVKIQQGARQAGAQVVQLATAEAVRAKAGEAADCYLFDLNCAATRPMESIAWLRAQGFAGRVIGFHSHVQVELKGAAIEAGCDEVYARSAMSDRMARILGGN